MLRLRSFLLSSPSNPHISSLHRFLVAAAVPAVSPKPCFSAEDYLVETCGLTRAQAIKASTSLSHLKSPSNPDAVLAFLAGLGLSGADVTAVVAKDPKLLCAGVERTLAPVVAGLTGLGLSRSEIARVVSMPSHKFRCRSIVSKLRFYLPHFGSSENLLRALQGDYYLLSSDLDRVVKPNIEFLRECGLGACDIAALCISKPRILTTNPEHVREMAVCAEGVGVPRGSPMFKHAFRAVAFSSKEKIAAKVEFLKKTFRWSDAEVGNVVCKAPLVLGRSNETLGRFSEFLCSEVALEPAYVAHRPVMLTLSLEGRLKPRYYVSKFLKANGLLGCDLSFYSTVQISESVFVKKFVCPHKEAAPHLAEDYAAACRGKVPTNFRFTWTTKNEL